MKRFLLSFVIWSLISAATAGLVVVSAIRLVKLRFLCHELCIGINPQVIGDMIWQISWFAPERELPMQLGTYYDPLTPTSATKLWTNHRKEYGDQALYALLAQRIRDKPVEDSYSPIPIVRADYVAFMRRGEEMDPGNALYNLKLARQYWSCAVRFQTNAMAVSKPHDICMTPSLAEPSTTPYLSRIYQNSRNGRMRVINQQYLDLGISEYRKAMRKQLRVYQPDLVTCALKTQPTLWLTDDYYQRLCLYYHVSASSMALFRPHRDVVKTLVQQGKSQQALELLDVNAYANTMLGDADVPESVLHNAIAQIRDDMGMRHDIALMAGNKDKAEILRLLYDRFRYDRLDDSSRIDSNYEPSQITTATLVLQVIWLTMVLVCVLLMFIGALRQAGWWAVKLCARHRTEPAADLNIPGYIRRKAARAMCIATVVILVPWPDLIAYHIYMAALWSLPMIWFVSGVVLYRRLITHCRRNSIPVPDPKTKAITFWLPVLLAVVVVIYSEVVNRVYTSEFVVSTVLAISTVLFVLVLISATWVKWRTPVYYAMVNRLVQKQLAWLTVFAAVMALLLMALEVVTLRLDHTHIGVYKSAELVVNQNKAANRKLVQQVQRIIQEANR